MVQLVNQTPAGPQCPSERVRALLQREIAFINNRSFQHVDERLEGETLESLGEADQVAATHFPRNLPSHLARLCEARILTAAEERELFRRMNYFKYRANAVRVTLDPQRPDMKAIERAERYLAAAQRVRDKLIRANMRLVISVVKRFVTSEHSFDDLLSDGTFSLMQAVDKFDYDRGFRFSTYAYRAIARNTYRKIRKHQKESVRFTSDVAEMAAASLVDSSSTIADVAMQSRLRERLTELVARLDRREQLIIRCRYALGAHRKSKTFQAIAEKLGVSKERVRQLEQRAMGKLRMMAAETNLAEACASALSN